MGQIETTQHSDYKWKKKEFFPILIFSDGVLEQQSLLFVDIFFFSNLKTVAFFNSDFDLYALASVIPTQAKLSHFIL